LAQYLRAHGIYTTYRYWPVHYAYGWQADVPNTEWIAAHTLLLPLHAELSEADVDYICDMFYVYDA
jgi:aminotransferase